MDGGVGTILREARNRRKVELSEVEEATRIRHRYLRAIEDEEWDVLPGDVYTRGFIRTYASFLGLDGERLVEDYREGVEKWSRPPSGRGSGGPRSGSGSVPEEAPWRFSAPPVAALVVLAVIAVAVLAITTIPGGGGGGDGDAGKSAVDGHKKQHSRQKRPAAQSQAQKPGVSIRLTAAAEVWACVLNAKGNPLVDGQILEAGAEAGPFRSGSFTVSFGNGEISILIDGKKAEIPNTSSPIGYSIGPSGSLKALGELERPTCA